MVHFWLSMSLFYPFNFYKILYFLLFVFLFSFVLFFKQHFDLRLAGRIKIISTIIKLSFFSLFFFLTEFFFITEFFSSI